MARPLAEVHRLHGGTFHAQTHAGETALPLVCEHGRAGVSVTYCPHCPPRRRAPTAYTGAGDLIRTHWIQGNNHTTEKDDTMNTMNTNTIDIQNLTTEKNETLSAFLAAHARFRAHSVITVEEGEQGLTPPEGLIGITGAVDETGEPLQLDAREALALAAVLTEHALQMMTEGAYWETRSEWRDAQVAGATLAARSTNTAHHDALEAWVASIDGGADCGA